MGLWLVHLYLFTFNIFIICGNLLELIIKNLVFLVFKWSKKSQKKRFALKLWCISYSGIWSIKCTLGNKQHCSAYSFKWCLNYLILVSGLKEIFLINSKIAIDWWVDQAISIWFITIVLKKKALWNTNLKLGKTCRCGGV